VSQALPLAGYARVIGVYRNAPQVPEPGPIYQDEAWKVYENAEAYPRARLAHEVEVEPTPQRLLKRLQAPDVDLHRVALLSQPLPVTLERTTTNEPQDIKFQFYEANQLELSVRAQSRALLVLSEIYYFRSGTQTSVLKHLTLRCARLFLPSSNCVAQAPKPSFSPSCVTIHVTKFPAKTQPG
jgi:hypothetical protein